MRWRELTAIRGAIGATAPNAERSRRVLPGARGACVVGTPRLGTPLAVSAGRDRSTALC